MASTIIISYAALLILLSVGAYAYTEEDARYAASSIIRENLTSTDRAIDYLLYEMLTLEKINGDGGYLIPRHFDNNFDYRFRVVESQMTDLGNALSGPITQKLDTLETQAYQLRAQIKRHKSDVASLDAKLDSRSGFNLLFSLGTFFRDVGESLINAGENPDAGSLSVPKTLKTEPTNPSLSDGESLLIPVRAEVSVYDVADGHPIDSALDSNPETFFSRSDKPDIGSPLLVYLTFDKPVHLTRLRIRSVKSPEDLLPETLSWMAMTPDGGFGAGSSYGIPTLTNGEMGDIDMRYGGDQTSLRWALEFNHKYHGDPLKIQVADLYFYGRY